MRKGLFADAPPFNQMIMLVFSMVVWFLLFMFAGILFAPLVMGIPISEMVIAMKSGTVNQNLNLLRYLQSIQGISLFIVPALFAGYLFSGNAIGYFGFCRTTKVKWFVATLVLMLAAIPCINLLGALNGMIVFPKFLSGLEQQLKAFEDEARKITELFLNVDSTGGMLFNIFMIALLPALGEELIFRGVVQKILIKWTGNIHLGIIIAGFFFSLMHVQFYGFFPRWLLGVMFGYLLVWSGTIWLPIFAHFVNNAVAVMASYLIHKGTISEHVESYGSAWAEIPVTIIATAICAWILWMLYKNYLKYKPDPLAIK